MRLFRYGILFLLLAGPHLSVGQRAGFNSFIERVADQYKVDVAIAPELIPLLDSIRNEGTEINTIQDLLYRLLNQSGITYQLIDGNKLMLRRESLTDSNQVLTFLMGTVVDAQTGKPLAYATVFAPSSNTACNTDDFGRFLLPLKDTTGKVRINYLGFKPFSIPLSQALRQSLTIQMEVNEIPLEEVLVIVPYQLMQQDYSNQSTDLLGYQYITEEQLLKWNAERLITNLTFYTHFSSDRGIRIRGTEAENSLILMEDIPVYDPYHFYNIFSPFNGQYFSSVNVYKNNLPIEYGGRIDGMIHVQSKRDQPASKLILDTDFLQTGLTTEIAISPEIYLTAGGRLSHTSILNDALSDSTAANFSLPGKFKDENEWSTSQQPTSDFYDINLGLVAKVGNANSMDFHFFDSKDQLDIATVTHFETSIHQHEIVSVHQVYSSTDVWKNRGYSAGLESVLGKKTTLHVNGFYSTFDKEVNFQSQQEEERHGDIEIRTNDGFQQSNLASIGAKSFFKHQTGIVSSVTAGLEYQHHDVNFAAKENNEPYIAQTQQEAETSLFGEYTSMLWKKISWTTGLRMTHLQSTSQLYSLPNLSLLYSIDTHWSLRAAYSKNLQYLVLSEPEADYPVLKSDKYMLGAGYNTSFFSMDAEVYYKDVQGLARVRALNPDPSSGHPDKFYRLFTGNGRTYGIDLTLLYKKKKFEGSVLYTLSKIEERYDLLFNGEYFAPQEDRRHQVKLSGIYSFGKFRALTLLTYKSKAPYLSLVRLDGRDGIGMANYKAVQRYLPAYFSLDLGLDYSFTLFKQPALVGFSLINATNHQNVSDLQHLGKISREGGGELYITSQTELLARTANVHFRYLFN
jgi:outer membrane receptor protein involved in Fe transport